MLEETHDTEESSGRWDSWHVSGGRPGPAGVASGLLDAGGESF